VFVAGTYWAWTSGTFRVDVTLNLNPGRTYLLTGALVGVGGGDYGQVYISTLCTGGGDLILCGIRDDPGDSPQTDVANLGIVEILSGAISVTVTLRSTGGLHRAEGVLYDIT
jgi:hypothetical protein